jgi:hypothetical protein
MSSPTPNMINPESVFDTIADNLASNANIKRGQMFGVPTVFVNGNAFISYFHGSMVFKLRGSAHAKAMTLPDAKAFDPSGKDRPMKEWVQLTPFTRDQWPQLADDALEYVSSLPAK